MLNYKAYKLGGKIPYKVTQMRWEDNDQLVAFDGAWHSVNDCILCAGTGIINPNDKEEIFEGDILYLDLQDPSCFSKDCIGVVTFKDGKFMWTITTKNGYSWAEYTLSGKSWKKLGHISYGIETFYPADDIKYSSFLQKMVDKIFGNFVGVMFEKHNKKGVSIKNDKFYLKDTRYATKRYEKSTKKLLHQYKNYLEIKDKIEKNEIYPDILNSKLKLIEKNN